MNEDVATLERFRVQELVSRYVDSLNHRDWKRFGDVWTEDGVLVTKTTNDGARTADGGEPQPLMRAVGRDAIVSQVSTYNKHPWLFQIPTGVLVQLDTPTTARIRHTLIIIDVSHMYVGICYDRAVKEGDGIWRLRLRDYRLTYFETVQRGGDIHRTLPDANYKALPSD